jgi:hypothetical protein
MPQGEGFWLHLPTGKAVSIHEHASAVVAAPKTYGIKPAMLKGLSVFDLKDREKILRMAMAKGWCRVRSSGAFLTFEFDYGTRIDALFAIVGFLKNVAGPLTRVEIHDLGRPRGDISALASDLLDPAMREALFAENKPRRKKKPIRR